MLLLILVKDKRTSIPSKSLSKMVLFVVYCCSSSSSSLLFNAYIISSISSIIQLYCQGLLSSWSFNRNSFTAVCCVLFVIISSVVFKCISLSICFWQSSMIESTAVCCLLFVIAHLLRRLMVLQLLELRNGLRYPTKLNHHNLESLIDALLLLPLFLWCCR